MKIVEDKSRLQKLQESLQTSDSLWIPVFSDIYRHYVNNQISFVYIYIIDTREQLYLKYYLCFVMFYTFILMTRKVNLKKIKIL